MSQGPVSGPSEAGPPAELLAAVSSLTERVAEMEDAVAELAEELAKLRKSVGKLQASVATRKQVKKLKKALDQLEVIELGADGTPEVKREDRADERD